MQSQHALYFYKNGDRYEGAFHADKRHGQGIIYFINGDIYQGQWHDNLKHGQGKYLYSEA